MLTNNWQLTQPIDAIMFDCDGTLSAIEGIDVLAAQNGVGDEVKRLTTIAMEQSGINVSLYQQRLNLVRPTQSQVVELGQHYLRHQTPDVNHVINLLQRLNKKIYLVSAGLYPAVAIFGGALQIPQENIFAVDIQFDQHGHYANFDEASPLVGNRGKRDIVKKLKALHPHIVHIGDGLNDIVVSDMVTRFIGYGGVFYRENIAKACDFYIKTSSMAGILPLVLTQRERDCLKADELALYESGCVSI